MFHLTGIPDLNFLRRRFRFSHSNLCDNAFCGAPSKGDAHNYARGGVASQLLPSRNELKVGLPAGSVEDINNAEGDKERQDGMYKYQESARPQVLLELSLDQPVPVEEPAAPVPGGRSCHAGLYTGKNWAPKLLMECGHAIAEKDTPKMQQLMWIVNELASPYGDCDQRLAFCFLQAFFYRLTGTGVKHYNTLCTAAEKSISFNQRRRILLKCQESVPYMTFGHVVANGALMEVLQQDTKVHIVDISSSYCSQWPTLLETLAMQPGKTPQVRLTVITFSEDQPPELIMQEVGSRLRKFARLMGIGFEFKVIQQVELEKLHPCMMDLRDDEALVINSIQSVHLVPDYMSNGSSSRDRFFSMLRSISPKLMTIVETGQNASDTDFLASFSDILRFFTTFFDSLEGSFPRASSERMTLERIACRHMVSFLACDGSINGARKHENSWQWAARLRKAGFTCYAWSNEIIEDVAALLKRYHEAWGHIQGDEGILYLTWKGQRTVFASAWKPNHSLQLCC